MSSISFKKRNVKVVLMVIFMSLVCISPIFASKINKYEIKSKATDLSYLKTNIKTKELNDAISSDLSNKLIKSKIKNIEVESRNNFIEDVNLKNLELLHRYARISSALQKSKGSQIIHMEDGDYKYVYSSYKKLPKKYHLAGNQDARLGYRFKTGGGFYFIDSGGPSINVSINFGGKFGKGSIGITFGKRSEKKGLFVSVPSRKYYYKLKVCKQYRVRKYIIYRRQSKDSEWYKFSGGIIKNLEKQDQYAIRTH